jgi:hypothetical protein
MSTRVIPGIIVSVVAGMIIFFTITFPRHYTDQLHDIDKGLAKLEGRLEGLGELRKYDAAPERIVAKPHAEELHGAIQAPKGAVNGYSFAAPKADDIVYRHFMVKGKLANKLPHRHLWLAVKIGGLVWPKEPEVKVAGLNWFGEVYEGGSPPEGKFILALYEVNEAGHQAIIDWLKAGRTHNYYPGLLRIPGSIKLTEVGLRLHSSGDLKL